MRIEECAILIRLTRGAIDELSPDELYEQTRGSWLISLRRAAKAEYAFSVHKGVVKEVYSINGWERAGTNSKRSQFWGRLAPDEMRQRYVGQSVREHFRKGNANPIQYTC